MQSFMDKISFETCLVRSSSNVWLQYSNEPEKKSKSDAAQFVCHRQLTIWRACHKNDRWTLTLNGQQMALQKLQYETIKAQMLKTKAETNAAFGSNQANHFLHIISLQ